MIFGLSIADGIAWGFIAYVLLKVATGRARQVKLPVTDEVLLRHLRGIQPYGVYLLVGDRTQAVVADFDREDAEPSLRFMRLAKRAEITSYLERSKSKGWHVWIFLDRPGPTAAKARAVVRWLLKEAGCPSVEVFPKQDRIEGVNRFGNFVNAPLFGRLVPDGRTVFVNPADNLRPWKDQWAVLEGVRRVSDAMLSTIIAANRLAPGHSKAAGDSRSVTWSPLLTTFGLAPCAQRMLAEGVGEYQRVACFRLALHLKKAGLPEDIAVACLRAWAAKNRPTDGKRVLTVGEIESQAHAAYAKDYRGCGCEEPAVHRYCMPTCALYRLQQPANHAESTPNERSISSSCR